MPSEKLTKKRIFIGLEEIASVTTGYAKGFRTLGYETYTIVLKTNPFYSDNQYNVVVESHHSTKQIRTRIHRMLLRFVQRLIILIYRFIHSLVTCDVFIFLFGSSFLPGYLDYPILKLFRKRIICVFLGSDIRYGYAFRDEMRTLGVEDELKPFADYIESLPISYDQKLRRVRITERYADLILSQAGYAQLQARPYMRMNIPIDLAQFQFNIPDRALPLVLHIPSNPLIKGTDFVIMAVEQLKKEGLEFEFRLIEKMPNARVRQLLTESDIVVDELYSDTIGVLSLEAMATGNVTLVRYAPEFTRVPPGCPAINVTKDTLAANLRKIILDRELRRQLAIQGRTYVETYHNHTMVAQQILEWLKPGAIQEFDFIPDYYNRFKLPLGLARAERKRRLSYVWHKITGQPQTRHSEKG